MIYGRNRSPYRVPCSGSVVDCIPGAKYQHSNGSTVTSYANVTTVKKSTADPISVIPYTRKVSGTTSPCTELLNPCTADDLHCGPWVSRDIDACGLGVETIKRNCFTAGATVSLQKCRQVGFQNLLIRHPWHGEYGPMSGHWQAPTDFCYEDVEDVGTSISVTCSIIPERTSADQTKYRTIRIEAEWNFTDDCELIADSTANYACEVTVDKYSGERTVGECSLPEFTGMLGAKTLAEALAVPTNISGGVAKYLSLLSTTLGAFLTGPNGEPCTVSRSGFEWTASFVADGTIPPLVLGDTYTRWKLVMNPSGTFSFENYGFVTTGCTDETLASVWQAKSGHDMSFGTTSVSYHEFQHDSSGEGDSVSQVLYELDVSIEFSDSYTVTQHRVLWDALRAQWNWDDFNQYPPRGWLIEDGVVANYDSRVTQAPIVQYSSPQASKSPLPVFGLLGNKCTVDDYTQPIGSVPYADWEQRSWFDPDCYRWTWDSDAPDLTTDTATGLELIYDGSIVGAPTHSANDGFFNFDHEVRERCHDLVFDVWLEYLYGYGAWNPATTRTDAPVNGRERNALFPAAATCWTNLAEEARGIPCKYLKWDGDVLFGMDYREIKLNFPAQDFARPYGADRWAMVETSTGCIKSVAGADIEVDFGTGTNTITTSDYVIIGGAEYDPGLYPVTGVAGDIITVGAKICDNPLSTAGNYLGKARYPSCPAFGGRLQIKGAVQSGPTLTLELFEAAPYLRTGDQIDTTGDSIPATTYTVTKVDDTHFEITATLIGAYGGQAWMTYHGGTPHAAPYYFVDNKSKGDYCLATWSGNLGEREWQERHRVITLRAETGCSCMSDPGPEIREHQATNGMPRWVTDFTFETHCVPVVPCPAQFIPMPEFPALSADGIYGNQWQAMVFQTMQELFWQAPHFPCDSYDPDTPPPPPLWEMDSTGNGNGDCAKTYTNGGGTEVKLYPHYPLVEARAEIPSGAPALPSDVKIGVAPLSDLQLATPVSGLPALPPRAAIGWLDDLPNIPQSFWVLTARQCNCIAGAGELGTDYAAYNLPCVE